MRKNPLSIERQQNEIRGNTGKGKESQIYFYDILLVYMSKVWYVFVL